MSFLNFLDLQDGIAIVAAMTGLTTIQTEYGDVQLGTFEEVLKVPGRYFNDHCLILAGDTWHLFSIVGNAETVPETPSFPADETSTAHATSKDLRTWKVHPDVLHKSGKWPEEGCAFAPNVIEHRGLYYMLYTSTDARRIQRLNLATSTDLFDWKKYQGNPVIVPSVSWAEWPDFTVHEPDPNESFGGCRDPHLLKLEDGRFVAYWVSRLRPDKFGEGTVGVAASISHDLIHWQEVGPVYWRKQFHRPLTLEVESPEVIFKDGKYWLFFKHGWWTWYVASDDPFDFTKGEAKRLGYAHAPEIFEWENQWWITHCNSFPDDFKRERSSPARGLYIGHIDWPEGGEPELQ